MSTTVPGTPAACVSMTGSANVEEGLRIFDKVVTGDRARFEFTRPVDQRCSHDEEEEGEEVKGDVKELPGCALSANADASTVTMRRCC